jgi:hypothetical protein
MHKSQLGNTNNMKKKGNIFPKKVNSSINDMKTSQVWWLIPVIIATQDVIGRKMV